MFISPEKWISDNFLTIIDKNMCDTSILHNSYTRNSFVVLFL